MRYRVQYNSDNGYSFSDPFDTFEEAKLWALKHVAPDWWTITTYYGG